MTLWMQFHRARRALGSMPVVGSSCNEENSQVDVGPQVKQEAEREGEEEEEQGHRSSSSAVCPTDPALCVLVRKHSSRSSNPLNTLLSDWLNALGRCCVTCCSETSLNSLFSD